MKLFIHPLSPNARKPRLVARALGLALDEQVVDFAKGEHRSPAYLAQNPNGMVPTLVDGDLVLWESHAIARYLCGVAGDDALYPAALRARADIDRWLDWTLAHFGPACSTLAHERLLKPMWGQPTDPAQVASGEAAFRRYGAVLDAHLEQHLWLAGTAPTLADYMVAAHLGSAVAAQYPWESFEHLRAWFGRMVETEAWIATAPQR